jgi:hypothetical protein
MGIKVTHGNTRDILRLGQLAGKAQKSIREVRRKEQQEDAVRAEKNRREMIEFNSQLDLDRMKFNEASKFQAEQRAQAWEIEKMSLSSQADFQREETDRQQRLGSIDKKLLALDKEKEAGRFGEDETAYSNAVNYWTAQKDFVTTGTKAPTIPWYQHPSQFQEPGAVSARGAIEAKAQGEAYGLKPYWMEFLEEGFEGTAEQKLAMSKLREGAGIKSGSIPWYLAPANINTQAGIQAQMNEGIILNNSERNELSGGGKVQDIGVQSTPSAGQEGNDNQPTAQQLRQQGTAEAYQKGKALGYWT